MPAARKNAAPDTVTVHVNPGTLVFWEGQQQGGTIDGVPAAVAEAWARHGWINTEQ